MKVRVYFDKWLKSRYRAQAVIDQLQLDRTAGDLLADVKVASDNSSFVIELTIENTDPDLANDIARTWGNLLIQWQTQNNDKLRKEDRITIEFIDDPQAAQMESQHGRRWGFWRLVRRHHHPFNGVD